MVGIICRERVAGERSGNIENAINAFNRALEVRKREEVEVEWAETQVNLAGAYWDRLSGERADNLERARQCLMGALEVFSWDTYPDMRIGALTHLSMTTRERLRGDRVQNAEQAISYLEEIAGNASSAQFRSRRARALQQLGVAYVERVRGDKPENLEIAIRMLRAAGRAFSRSSYPVEWARTRAELGIAYIERIEGDRKENLTKALRAFKEASAIFNRSEHPTNWAWMQHELGIAYKCRAQASNVSLTRSNVSLKRSIAAFKASLEIRTIEASPDEWASSQEGLGNSYALLRDDGEGGLGLAAGCYEAAAWVYEDVGSPHDRRRAWESLGDTYRILDRWDDAVVAYRRAIKAADELYDSSILPSGQQLELARFMDLYASAAYAMTRSQAADLREAVVILEGGRARRLGEVLSRTDFSGFQELDVQDQEALRVAVEHLQSLEAAENRPGFADTVLGLGPMITGGGLDADRAARRRARAALHAEVETARLKVRTYVSDLAVRLGVPSPTSRTRWQDIADAVQQGEPIAYLLAYGEETVVFMVERQADEISVLLIRIAGLGERELADLLSADNDGQSIGGLLVGQATDNNQMIRGSLPRVNAVLGGTLVSKLDAQLRSINAGAVVLIPTNFLVSVPLHTASYHVDGRPTCLLREFRVSYAPSARTLFMARQRIGGRKSLTLAGIGNPSNDLAYAEAELQHIATLFPQDAVELLYRSDATNARTLTALRGARYVHLSCHGVFDPELPVDSYLKLAGSDRISVRDLLAAQGFRDVRLVTASACRTAVADFHHLPDEVIGLPSAFIQAGAAGVVGTLWSVDDLSTALVMCRFYELHLTTTSVPEGALHPAEALRIAQLWLADANAQILITYCDERESLRTALSQTIRGRALTRMTPSAQPFSHPYYWAPFVFIGA
jgi:CHAT domain-containing protein/tetratricopeptide (TPR) repeat protein